MHDEQLEPDALVRSLWASEQFPDRRLYKRAMTTTARLLEVMSSSGDGTAVRTRRAQRRGSQRLFHNERIDAAALEQSAATRLSSALASLTLLVLAHDTTEVDLHGRDEPDDAGPLRSSHSRGYLLHLCSAIGDGGALLGIVCYSAWTRTWKLRKQNHATRRPADKESSKWRKGIRSAVKRLGDRPDRILIHVMDREGDIHENFAFAHKGKHLVLARAAQDRVIAEGPGRLWDYLEEQPATRLEPIEIKDEEARTVGARNPIRTVGLSIRFARVTLAPSATKKIHRGRKPLTLDAVYVREEHPPKNGKRVEWMLLTTFPVRTVEDAKRVLCWYRMRWGVEEFNKILKSGCRIEKDRVDEIGAFRRMLAFVVPIATHLARWTHVARVTPTEAANNHVSPETIEALKEACRYHKLTLPHRAWTVGDVVTRLAQLGGHEIRPDALPGTLVIWRGYRNFRVFWRTLEYAKHRVKQPRC